MLEYRPFDGSLEEFSQFVIATWESTYLGKMPVPQWSAEYFDWQLRLSEPENRNHLFAAYDGTQIAGALAMFPATFELHGKRISGAQGSWLSISNDYRGQGIAKDLHIASRKQLQQEERDVMLGFKYFGSRRSLGINFWKKMQQQKNTMPAGEIGFWARVIDPRRAAKWNLNFWESKLTALATPVTFAPKVATLPNFSIRPVTSTDLPACAALAQSASTKCDLRLVWSEAELEHQFGLKSSQADGPVDCTSVKHLASGLVAEKDGKVCGCISYHVLPIRGQCVEPVGIIDLVFVDQLTRREQVALVNAALEQMQKAGAILALKTRTHDYPKGLFLRWGWVGKPAETQILLSWVDQSQEFSPVKSHQVLWR